MSDESPQLLTTDEAAKILGMKKQTLEAWRVRGGGPKYKKIGLRAVRYTREDIENFENKDIRTSTSKEFPNKDRSH